ncbi:hypothetical protein HB780_28640 [Rhizobium lusitanum]|uniref:thermonuclease family protein n=1 Tax=Rhizobium lusitanum TaxID=293958 RepID=UPI00160F66C8|nr:thermonuclease family protein [Rhizobium lusitanum]QND49466.1 hypothetical protein HB780_28640 [Rhizobium lusitanum]
MRRDIWLAGAAGAVVGSWLTLVVVQVNEHGFHLPGLAASKVEAETRPAAAPALTPAPVEIAQADVTPAQTLTDTAPKKMLPITAGTVVPAATVAADSTSSQTTAPSEPLAATSISAPAVTPADQDKSSSTKPAPEPQGTPPTDLTQSEAPPAKTPDVQPVPKDATGDDTIKTEAPGAEKAEPEQSPSTQAPADQTKAEQALPPPPPADQADRAAAAAARRTVPMTTSSQQASPGDSQTPGDAQKQAGGTEPVELTRPSSDRAGMLTVGNRSVQLSGIIPTDVGRMCAGSNGKSWPCGTAARTAFRMYLRGRIIDCDLPSATWQGTVTGHCRYVRIDLSEWLVRFGWAEPEAGSPLEAVAEQAKQQKRGIYGDDPRKGRKSTLAPAPAKEDPLNPI